MNGRGIELVGIGFRQRVTHHLASGSVPSNGPRMPLTHFLCTFVPRHLGVRPCSKVKHLSVIGTRSPHYARVGENDRQES